MEAGGSPAAQRSPEALRIACYEASERVSDETPSSASQRRAAEEDLQRALAANGLELTTIRDLGEPVEAKAIWAPGASLDELERLSAHDVPLLTDVEASDMARITALVELGVDEVLPRPLRPEELARRTLRAIKRYRGRRRPGR